MPINTSMTMLALSVAVGVATTGTPDEEDARLFRATPWPGTGRSAPRYKANLTEAAGTSRADRPGPETLRPTPHRPPASPIRHPPDYGAAGDPSPPSGMAMRSTASADPRSAGINESDRGESAHTI